MKQAIIIDVDFTLLDSYIPVALKDRAKSLRETARSFWDKFYLNLDLCTKNDWCYFLIDQMTLNNDITVLFITGREERARKQTEKFLKFAHKINYELLMRPMNDLRTDVEIKKEILDDVVKRYHVIFAIDDKEDNCQLFKSYGVPTLKVV